MGSERHSYLQLLSNPSEYTTLNYGTVTHVGKMEENMATTKISVARRFFTLLTVFDFLFTSLLWIICTVTSNYSSLESAFEAEVIHYTIKSSAFDIVVLASVRAFLILLFYALLRISHWWVISITTAGSGIFIVAKVLVFEWASASSKTASVILLLYSFVISWVEAWFLDCRVVPSETQQHEFLATEDHERAPIVPHSALSRSQSDDGSAFYSPPGSDEEEAGKEHDGSTVSEVEWLSPKNSGDASGQPSDDDYRHIAEEALDSAIKVVNSDGWTKEKTQGNDTIYSKNLPPYGKIYKFVGPLNSSGTKVIDELYYKAEEIHKWNPTVKKFRVIQSVDNHIDVTHVVSNEAAAGLIASRDFVNVRIWKKQAASIVHALVSTTHPDIPVVSKYVRGEHGPSIYILSPVEGKPNTCVLQWLLNANLKGWIPQYLLDQAMVTVMLDYVQALRNRLSSGKENT